MASGSSTNNSKDSRWYFTAEQLANSPSRKCGISADQELNYRQTTANLIQDMGQRLQVSQLCINTAMVYMHRFYAFHSFSQFHRDGIAAASLFLAAKVEEQPRKLEHVIKVAHMCRNLEPPDTTKESYQEEAQDLVFNENVLLQTLGFDVAIDHPHTHVVRTCQLVKACKDLAQMSYFLASNSLHLTTMCLQYRPTVVACFCIYLACKWSRWEIAQSTEGRMWFHYVDTSVTKELLDKLTDEFIDIYEKSPARLKRNLNSIKALAPTITDSQKSMSDPNRSRQSNGENRPSASASHSQHHRPHHSLSSHHSSSSRQQVPASGDKNAHPSASHRQSHPSHVSGSSSTSSSNRHRPDRPANSVEQPFVKGSQPGVRSNPSGSSSNNNSGNPNRPANVPPSSGTSSASSGHRHNSGSSHDLNYPNQTHQNVKQQNRSMNPQYGQSMSSTSSRFSSNQKPEHKHSLNKDGTTNNNRPPSANSDPMKSNTSSTSSSSSLSKQQTYANRHLPQPSQMPGFINSGPSVVKSSDYAKQQAFEQSSLYKNLEQNFRNNNKTVDQITNTPPRQSTGRMPSIFSPEVTEKPFAFSTPPGNSVSSAKAQESKSLGLTPSSNKLSTNSPKKMQQQERRSETPKKEKLSKSNDSQSNSNQQKLPSQNSKRPYSPKKLDGGLAMPGMSLPRPLSPLDTKTESNSGASVPVKRATNHEDFREPKVMKFEHESPKQDMKIPKQSTNTLSLTHQSAIGDTKSGKAIGTSYSSTMNGIETNPDLVSSLLKESLFKDKNAGSLSQSTASVMNRSTPVTKTDNEDVHVDVENPAYPNPHFLLDATPVIPTSVTTGDDEYKSKSEKKKKKEKHKHKEKGRDKEERKKHKKDKERHKDRERTESSGNVQPSLKMSIPKDKTTMQEDQSIKIKIPKDLIKSDLTSGAGESSAVQHTPLKIKIPRGKIEGYSGDESFNNTYSSSSGKRDKDREKEKSLKRQMDHNFGGYSKQGMNGTDGSFGDLHSNDFNYNQSGTNDSMSRNGSHNKSMPQYNSGNNSMMSHGQQQLGQHLGYNHNNMMSSNQYNMFQQHQTNTYQMNQMNQMQGQRMDQKYQQQHQQNSQYSNHFGNYYQSTNATNNGSNDGKQ